MLFITLCVVFIDKARNDEWKKGLTNPDGPNEFDLGKSIIDAAAAAAVQHLVFSSGPNCTELTNGKVNMKAMNCKFFLNQQKPFNIY